MSIVIAFHKPHDYRRIKMKSNTTLSAYAILRLAMLLFGSAFFGPVGIIVFIVIVVLVVASEKDSRS
jgi:hypothetical protein